MLKVELQNFITEREVLHISLSLLHFDNRPKYLCNSTLFTRLLLDTHGLTIKNGFAKASTSWSQNNVYFKSVHLDCPCVLMLTLCFMYVPSVH